MSATSRLHSGVLLIAAIFSSLMACSQSQVSLAPSPVLAESALLVSGVSPDSGQAGATVVITGTGLAETMDIWFSAGDQGMSMGVPATFAVIDDGRLEVTVPPGCTSGPIILGSPVEMTVWEPFTVVSAAAPAITSFSPTSGGMGTSVVITGSDFTGTTAVTFDGILAGSFRLLSDGEIQTWAPSGSGQGPLAVVNTVGTAVSSADFVWEPPPLLTAISASSGMAGDSITFSGSGLLGTYAVLFADGAGQSSGGSGTPATFDVIDDGELRVTVPLGCTSGSIRVESPGGVATWTSFGVQSSAAPTLSGFGPTSGGVGTWVLVWGSEFTGANGVTFNGALAERFDLWSDTQMLVQVPPGASTGPVSIINTAGADSSSADFVLLLPPTITSVAPPSGVAGDSITVTGSGFAGATRVSFASSSAGGGPNPGGGVSTTFTVVNDSTITAVVPSGSTRGGLEVQNPVGSATFWDFDVQSSVPPTISDFSPTSGGGGSEVRISGSGFTGTRSVGFGGRVASFSIESDGSLVVWVPYGAGSGPITVTNTQGSAQTAADFVVLAPPSVTGFAPPEGVAGDPVTVTGTGLAAVTSVRFSGRLASFTITNDTELTATVPTSAVSGPIEVFSPTGGGMSPDTFIVRSASAPQVSGFSPPSGRTGTQVQVSGSGFSDAERVTFGGAPAEFWVDSPSLLWARVPSNAATGRIEVTNGAGAGQSAVDFTVLPPPTITSVSPTSGRAGDPVTLRGTGFSLTTSVRFGFHGASFQVVDDTELRAFVPPGAMSGDLWVDDVRAPGTFTVLSSAPPEVISFWPTSGGQWEPVRINGASFTGATLVTFGGVAARDFYVEDDGSITAYVPEGAVSGPIAVTNSEGVATSIDSFTVIPPPRITGFTPAAGSVGDPVTITGAGLSVARDVFFGGGPWGGPDVGPGSGALFVIVSDSELTAYVPAGATNGPIVVLTNSDWAESTSFFTVLSSASPTITDFSPSSGAARSEVQITGTGFSGTTEVRFAGMAADFSILGDTAIAAFVPNGASTGPITVTNTLGSAASSASFTVIPPPRVTSVAPSSGQSGTSVTISGSGFLGATSVSFGIDAGPSSPEGGGLAAVFNVDSDSTITAYVPAGAVSGRIRVSAPGGDGLSPTPFVVESSSAPVIASFDPPSGTRGSDIRITGSGFTGVTGVTLGGISAAFRVGSDTELVAFVPDGATSGPITITNTVGSATSATDFVVPPPPSIQSFTPVEGGLGDMVTITGSGFSNAHTVGFSAGPDFPSYGGGPIAAPGGSFTDAPFTVVSDTEITAWVPSGATTGPLWVGAAGGLVSSSASFRVLGAAPPRIDGFSPTSGEAGSWVMISGADFTGVTDVTFAGTPVAWFQLAGDRTIYTSVPDGAITGPIRVTNSAGATDSSASFTVLPPIVVSSFTPVRGPVGTEVTITGSSFSGATQVRFGNTEARASFVIDSDTQIRATVPAGAASGEIRVYAQHDGASSQATFTVESSAPPLIAGFAPEGGPAGTRVVLFGSGFTGVTDVSFAGDAGSWGFHVRSDSELEATVPPDAMTGPITVTNTAGSATSSASFVVSPPPVISSFSPASGTVGDRVVITGSGFLGTEMVRFGGGWSDFQVMSDTEIVAWVPSGAVTGPIYVGATASSQSFTVQSWRAPAIAGFTPTSGREGDGTRLAGSGFTGVTSVTFNGVAADSMYVESDGSLFAYVPTGASTGPITVTNTIGSAVSSADFVVLPPPAITSFAPTSGAPGTSVRIDGSNLDGVESVSFGNDVRATFTIDSSTQITATVPVGASTGRIMLNGRFRSAGTFTVLATAAPAITGFTPAVGGFGSVVLITGTGFSGTTAVWFGGTRSLIFGADSDTELQAAVPPGAATGPIRVDNNVGSAVSADDFVIGPSSGPSIDAVSPGAAPVGAQVTLTGSGLDGALFVGFTDGQGGGVQAEVTSTSPTQIVLTVPIGAITGFIVVATPDGVAVAPFFVGSAPTIASLSPAAGPSGSTFAVIGSGFTGVTEVTVGGVAASFTIDADDRLSVVAGAVSGPVRVTNPAGSSSSAEPFTVVPPPSLSVVAPNSGPTAGGTLLTLTGDSFQAGASVWIGTTAATDVTLAGPGTLLAVSGASAAGLFDVTVENPDGQRASLAAAFTYVPPPSAASLDPISGPATGGTPFSLDGSDFINGLSVSFGGALAAIDAVTSTRVSGRTPPRAVGLVDVVVENPDGQRAVLAGAFTFEAAPPPSISGLAPSLGPSTGSTSITVSGAGFAPGAIVRLGGVAATDVVVAPDSISAVTAAHAPGTVALTVTNPDGQSSTLAGAFTYNAASPPAITSIAPANGPSTGGTAVTVSGSGFASGAAVRIGGVPASAVVVVSASSVTATTGAHAAGSVDVVVQNPDGQVATLTAAFTYDSAPPPSVSSVTPSRGPTTGGTSLTISGSGFADGAGVLVGGVAASNVVVGDAATLTCATGAHAPGSVDVVVRNPDGQAATQAGVFTYESAPPPLLSTVRPSSGPSNGGTQLTLLGSGFAAGATVAVDGVAALSVQVIDAGRATAVTPSHVPGTVNVVLTNADGQASSLAGSFTYAQDAAPSVAGVSPASGSTNGGTVVTLTGSDFAPGATVYFGGVASVTGWVSATSLLVTTPPHAAGLVDVSVTNPDGQSGTRTAAFTYEAEPAPTLAAVAPDRGPAAGGTSITLTGSGFVSGTSVTIGGAAALDVFVADGATLTALTPAGVVGSADVTVQNPDGQSASLAGGYIYTAMPAPQVAEVTPASGDSNGGTSVTVRGSGFVAGATVTFDGVAAASVSVDSDSSISAITPAHAAGAVDLVVENPDGQIGRLASAFTFVAGQAPVLSSIEPPSGPAAGATAFTLAGSGFASGARVSLGGVAAESVVVASSSSITAVSAAHAAGVVDVVVENPDGQSATLAAAFSYVAPPVLLAVSPAEGPTYGGTRITLAGSELQPGASVSLGGVAATDVALLDAGIIVATAPSHDAGAVDVLVTNPDGQSALLAAAFTYVEYPSGVSAASGCACDGVGGVAPSLGMLAAPWLLRRRQRREG